MNTQLDSCSKSIVNNEDEIDLIVAAKTLWKGRKTLLKWILYGLILGIIIVLLSPKEYTATTSLVPQNSHNGNNSGGLSSLAAMAGFDLDLKTASDEMNPMVYPQIVSSTPFQLELMNMTFNYSSSNHPMSLFEYYTQIANQRTLYKLKKYSIGLPGLLLSLVKSEESNPESKDLSPIVLTKDQEEVRKILEEKVILKLDSKQGFLTLSVSFPEAFASAEIAENARGLLQKYITSYKIGKASAKLSFIQERYDENKKEFEKAQDQLAGFRDQNKNVSSEIARTHEERLQGEYNIALNVFNELAKQLEQAKIQVKEDTPVFSVLEPARVPTEKSKPRTMLILAICIIVGGLAGFVHVIGKSFTTIIRARWKELD